MSFWHAIKTFDPETADPHFCWALLELENQHYVTINRGKITATKKARIVSPQSILDRPCTVAEADIAKAALQMERDGLSTIKDGEITLTKKGIAEAEKRLEGKPIEISDETAQYIKEHSRPGESPNDVLCRLLGL